MKPNLIWIYIIFMTTTMVEAQSNLPVNSSDQKAISSESSKVDETKTQVQKKEEASIEDENVVISEEMKSPVSLDGIIESYIYDPRDKRDPFAQLTSQKSVTKSVVLEPLQRFDLSEIELTGIIWNVPEPKALFTTPDKESHMVKKNTLIGPNNGFIGAIREGEIIIFEPYENQGKTSYRTKTLKLDKARGSK